MTRHAPLQCQSMIDQFLMCIADLGGNAAYSWAQHGCQVGNPQIEPFDRLNEPRHARHIRPSQFLDAGHRSAARRSVCQFDDGQLQCEGEFLGIHLFGIFGQYCLETD